MPPDPARVAAFPAGGGATAPAPGRRAASQPTRFRYLADGGHWFDDPQADVHDHEGALLML
jgi:hypothetical protein